MARILIIDDVTSIRNIVASMLQKYGHRVFPASSGEEALNLARSKRVHLAITDVNMPGMEARELCQRLRAVRGLAETPLYVLTGILPDNATLAPLREYTQGILNKPPNPGELLAALDALA